jgi:hypothetical protein
VTDGRCTWKGISASVLEHAGVVADGELVRLPYRRTDGTTQAWRVFAPSGRCWWDPAGLDHLVPFGIEALPGSNEAELCALLITEGESDALAIREAFAGRTGPGRIGGYRAMGLPGAGTWRREWRSFVDPFALVYVVGDGDGAGRRMIKAVRADVPWARPLWLPAGEDARSLLQRHGPQALDGFIAEADTTALALVAFLKAANFEDFVQLVGG